ncbi:MAG: OmpA family protein, partial [Fulvivirga sp.]|nr:OmpA family protein [Fulvivirga sp.]
DRNKVLIMSLESYGTYGAEDIYISFKNDGKWTEPKNLGSVINTRFQELTPTIYNDSLLYFASNGHGGKGSTDIFVSRRLDDSWLNWSEPVNVEAINTDGRELSYRQYDAFAIYTSTLNSDGYGDIKLYTEANPDTLFRKNIATDSVLIEEVAVEEIPDNTILLYGDIRASRGDVPLNPAVNVNPRGRGQTVEATIKAGVYMVNLKSPGNYEITVSAPGYVAQQEIIQLQSGQAKKLKRDFTLQPIAVGTRVNLKNVLFEQSKPEILESSYHALDLVVKMMKDNPEMKIKLEGHTDNRGNPKHNLRLSKQRVEAVEDYLVAHGISRRRIKGKGYGGSRPIADNDNPVTRKLNRRVEFIIIRN